MVITRKEKLSTESHAWRDDSDEFILRNFTEIETWKHQEAISHDDVHSKFLNSHIESCLNKD